MEEDEEDEAPNDNPEQQNAERRQRRIDRAKRRREFRLRRKQNLKSKRVGRPSRGGRRIKYEREPKNFEDFVQKEAEKAENMRRRVIEWEALAQAAEGNRRRAMPMRFVRRANPIPTPKTTPKPTGKEKPKYLAVLQSVRLLVPPKPIKEREEVRCSICKDTRTNVENNNRSLVATHCGHIYCNTCVEQLMNSSQRRCSQCRAQLTRESFHPLYM